MERITVNLTPGGALGICHASQYDLGREIAYDLMNGDSVYTLDGTETVTMVIKRPDGVTVERAISNTSDSYVIWTSDEGDCDAAGIAECELRFTKGSQDLGSGNFLMLVEADPFNDAGVVVETVGPADICTFETTLAEPLQSVLVNVLATGGNGTADNPNPINGYTEANITRCGVNLWDEEWEVGTINNNTGELVTNSSIIRSKNFIPVSGGVTILLYATTTSNMWLRVFEYDKNKNFIASDARYTGTTYQLNANTAYLKFYVKSNYGTTYNNDISILYPSNITTAYHPYTGNTYTIAFGQTVYGGVLDVTRGKLHVTHGIASFDGTEYYILYIQTVVCGKTFAVGSGTNADMICSHTNKTQINYATSQKQTFEFRNLTSTWGCATLDDFKTFVATQYANGTPLTILYPLETPFDIDLTPEVISAVVGENNVFADCGQTTVKYLKAGA